MANGKLTKVVGWEKVSHPQKKGNQNWLKSNKRIKRDIFRSDIHKTNSGYLFNRTNETDLVGFNLYLQWPLIPYLYNYNSNISVLPSWLELLVLLLFFFFPPFIIRTSLSFLIVMCNTFCKKLYFGAGYLTENIRDVYRTIRSSTFTRSFTFATYITLESFSRPSVFIINPMVACNLSNVNGKFLFLV